MGHFFIILFFASSLVSVVHAAIGDQADFVGANPWSNTLGMTFALSQKHERFKIQESRTDSITIRQYVSPQGIVFGAAWHGLHPAEPREILGRYAEDYLKAQKKVTRVFGKRNQKIETGQIIVEKWGHMRNIHGRAFAPRLVPPNVSLDEIK